MRVYINVRTDTALRCYSLCLFSVRNTLSHIYFLIGQYGFIVGVKRRTQITSNIDDSIVLPNAFIDFNAGEKGQAQRRQPKSCAGIRNDAVAYEMFLKGARTRIDHEYIQTNVYTATRRIHTNECLYSYPKACFVAIRI